MGNGAYSTNKGSEAFLLLFRLGGLSGPLLLVVLVTGAWQAVGVVGSRNPSGWIGEKTRALRRGSCMATFSLLGCSGLGRSFLGVCRGEKGGKSVPTVVGSLFSLLWLSSLLGSNVGMLRTVSVVAWFWLSLLFTLGRSRRGTSHGWFEVLVIASSMVSASFGRKRRLSFLVLLLSFGSIPMIKARVQVSKQ